MNIENLDKTITVFYDIVRGLVALSKTQLTVQQKEQLLAEIERLEGVRSNLYELRNDLQREQNLQK
ncbi:MAG: hypothetical protein RR630_09980 [Coprobacillus sp.]